MKTKILVSAAMGVIAVALTSCEVEKTEEGKMPEVDVDVKEGNLPKYDVDAPDVDVDVKKKTVEVPVPDVDIDVTMPEETDPPRDPADNPNNPDE